MSNNVLRVLIVGALVLGGAWIWFSRVPSSETSRPSPALPLAGHQAPPLNLPALNGGAIDLAALRGQPVVLNFWASWCGPCEAEMPELQAAFAEYGDKGLVILGVNQGEEEAIVRNYLARLGLTFPVALDRQFTASGAYKVNSLPTTFFIDRDGVIRGQIVGQMNTAVLRQQIRSIYP